MPNRDHLYLGRAGQMAVMAEFLARRYNVAVPEVDVGDDILVVEDNSGEYWRIQVKTAISTATSKGHRTVYTVKYSQITSPTTPETWFIFANRFNDRWHSFIVIPRLALEEFLRKQERVMQSLKGNISLHFSCTESTAFCMGQDFSQFLDNWQDWPQLSDNE